MRIPGFSGYIKKGHLKDYCLRDCNIVVDAQNFFYNLYQDSRLQHVFGCESDKYADHLRRYLSMFKKANVNCYFIFKGGHANNDKRITKFKETTWEPFDIDEELDKTKYNDRITPPIFMKDVYKQVMDEMNFNYTICEYESKRECIALAQIMKCAVVSDDIEFCFSGLPYIVQSTLKFDEKNNRIKCGIFSLDDFLEMERLDEGLMAIFVPLTDENEFPKGHFSHLFRNEYGYKRILEILSRLRKTSKQNALEHIFKHITQEDKEHFLSVQRKTMEMIRRKETQGIPATYLLNGNKIEVTAKDEFWFQKGVASKKIAIQFVNLARSAILETTWAISDRNDDDARFFSKEIITYVYNLLTNFEKDKLVAVVNKTEVLIPVKKSVRKPVYDGISSPFENGWKNLKGELFAHFLTEALKGVDLGHINQLPEDSKMIMIALIYFIVKKKKSNIKNEICSIILSYIALGVVAKADKNKNLKTANSTNNNSLNEKDMVVAKDILAKYLAVVKNEEAKSIFDVKLLHPLVEFQHCLENLNYLNVLCGKLYKPTIYSKTYNGTFVYKVLYTIQTEYEGNCMRFLTEELNSAPSVLSYIVHLIELCYETTCV